MKCSLPDIGLPLPTPSAQILFWKTAKQIILMACLIFSFGVLTSLPAVANPKYASVIMEESSGRVLYSRSADKQLFPASLTKIMTLYLFEALQNRRVSFSTHESHRSCRQQVALKTVSQARADHYSGKCHSGPSHKVSK